MNITIKSCKVGHGAWACACCGEPENDENDKECQECGASRSAWEETTEGYESYHSLRDREHDAGRRMEERYAAKYG